MLQAKFSVEETQARFLNNFKAYGFKDKNSMLREAIELFKKEIELESLRKSAELYSEVCSENVVVTNNIYNERVPVILIRSDY